VSSLCGYKIHKISCGGQHVAVIVNSGQLLTWGKGDFGRLGLGNTVSVSVPTLVTIPPVASSGALSPDTSNHGIGMNSNNNSGHGSGGSGSRRGSRCVCGGCRLWVCVHSRHQ
jgi:alpha-tubulin suppressor-like RCC1 family protein